MTSPLRDRLARPLRSLRISVTDRCNLRCRYCMPEDKYVWLLRESILRFEEMHRLARIFTGLGVNSIRLTGGEPLLRVDLTHLVAWLAALPGVEDLALTTNGVLLADQAAGLRAAGLSRVTVSLDTTRPERFATFARRQRLGDVMAGLEAAVTHRLTPLKVNAVVMRGVNDDELGDLLAVGARFGAEVRFIEYMDVGGATEWSADDVVSRQDILTRIEADVGSPVALPADDPSAPAQRFRLPDGRTFGIIASTTAPFCRACDRARLTADGMWYTCLYSDTGIDLREPLRGGADDAAIASLIRRHWEGREDRGAELRATEGERVALYQLEGLRADPHREMHTRGG